MKKLFEFKNQEKNTKLYVISETDVYEAWHYLEKDQPDYYNIDFIREIDADTNDADDKMIWNMMSENNWQIILIDGKDLTYWNYKSNT